MINFFPQPELSWGLPASLKLQGWQGIAGAQPHQFGTYLKMLLAVQVCPISTRIVIKQLLFCKFEILSARFVALVGSTVMWKHQGQAFGASLCYATLTFPPASA